MKKKNIIADDANGVQLLGRVLRIVEDMCSDEAKKYKTVSDFKVSSEQAYNIAEKNGWLCNYTWFDNKKKWRTKSCIEEAKKYKTVSDFKNNSYDAYLFAKKKNLLDMFHWFESTNKPRGYWDYETCKAEAKKYTSRGEFQKNSCSAYTTAYNNGWLNEYTWMRKKTRKPKWDYETCKAEAKKYDSKSDFKKFCGGAYKTAHNNGWLNEYTWMRKKTRQPKKWDYEACKAEADKYNSRFEFYKGNKSAYLAARRNGWLDKCITKSR